MQIVPFFILNGEKHFHLDLGSKVLHHHFSIALSAFPAAAEWEACHRTSQR